MTSTVTAATQMTIHSTTYGWLSTGLGLIVILLLTALLVQKELMRALDHPRSEIWLRTLDIAIMPLILGFGFIMLMRLINLIYPL
jgi:predicted Na+-dependent transporter